MCDAKCKHAFNLVVLKNVPTRVFVYFLHAVKSLRPKAARPPPQTANKCYANQRFKNSSETLIFRPSAYDNMRI